MSREVTVVAYRLQQSDIVVPYLPLIKFPSNWKEETKLARLDEYTQARNEKLYEAFYGNTVSHFCSKRPGNDPVYYDLSVASTDDVIIFLDQHKDDLIVGVELYRLFRCLMWNALLSKQKPQLIRSLTDHVISAGWSPGMDNRMSVDLYKIAGASSADISVATYMYMLQLPHCASVKDAEHITSSTDETSMGKEAKALAAWADRMGL